MIWIRITSELLLKVESRRARHINSGEARQQSSRLVYELTGVVHDTVSSGNQIELLQEFSFNRFGSTMSVLDLVHLGSSCSLRTFARLASACSVFGMGRFSSSPAFHATKSSSVQGRRKAE